jgi:hypothetical protein
MHDPPAAGRCSTGSLLPSAAPCGSSSSSITQRVLTRVVTEGGNVWTVLTGGVVWQCGLPVLPDGADLQC